MAGLRWPAAGIEMNGASDGIQKPRVENARWGGFAMLVLLAVALATRLPAYIGDVYGEQDAARLVVDALAWARAGVRNEVLSEYRYYTSSGYIGLIAGVVWLARIADLHLAQILGAINLLLAVLIVVPAYRLAARLTDPGTALLAGLAMLFMPMVWHAGTYGFPHLLSVFCLLCAYLLYDRHLTGPALLGPRADLAAVLLLLVACALLKADAYLGAAGMPALLLVRQAVTVRRAAVLAVLLAIPLLVAVTVAHLLLQASPTIVEYMQGYERQYPIALWHLRTWWYVEGLLMAFGFYTMPIFALGALVMLATKRWPLAMMLALWVVVPMAYWFFRPGDSARHHLPEAFPVALGVGIALATLARTRWVPYAGLVLLLGANYLRYPPTDNNFRPSGRVVETARVIRERVTQYHRLAEAYEATPASRKVLLGLISNPYVDAEVLLRAERVLSVSRHPLLGYDAIQISSQRGGRDLFSASVRVNPEDAPAVARLFREKGYTPYAIEYDLATGKRIVSQRLQMLEPG